MNFIIEYSVEFIFGILSGAIIYLYKKVTDYHKVMNATKKGVQVLLKSKIIEKYMEYRNTGCVSIHDQEIINELYNEYKTLGGNGVVGRLVDDIAEMEVNRCKEGVD